HLPHHHRAGAAAGEQGGRHLHSERLQALLRRRGQTLLIAAMAAAAASLCFACQGGPTLLPMAVRCAAMLFLPSAVAASRSTASRSYQCTRQPRRSAAEASAMRYRMESAMLAARVSLMHPSMVAGSGGQRRMEMPAIDWETSAASDSKASRAPVAAASPTRSTNAIASGSEIFFAQGLSA